MHDEMRLAGICKDCMKRLGVDERLTVSLKVVNLSQLPTYDAKSMADVQFATGRNVHQGTTKITYKVAKTVKEALEDAQSHPSHPGQ